VDGGTDHVGASVGHRAARTGRRRGSGRLGRLAQARGRRAGCRRRLGGVPVGGLLRPWSRRPRLWRGGPGGRRRGRRLGLRSRRRRLGLGGPSGPLIAAPMRPAVRKR
jgi:hypothetical protein